ncbi:MAG TPA: sigma-54 dependent transcriptional regulator [Thermodesulfovibrionales bacterium]|nr:sigma-54 dependent transcriptional regulator [Thermodesulfovibrionales bacterium]
MISAKEKIIIIDDDEIVRKSCGKILAPEGYALEFSANSTEGLNRLRKEHFDLVLTDLRLPHMDGMEVLRMIKENWPGTEVIVITGFGSVKTAVEALRYGAYDYIEKPFAPEQLLHAVTRCLERKHLLVENLRLRQEMHALYRMENITGTSAAMQKVFHLIATVAPAMTTVLITGESGTGKELIARALHHNSPRRNEPFLVVDCGTIPDALMEAELFGYMKGSFTGAMETRRGLLELAHRGTILFDEIGNLGIPMQAKLLRVLQEKEFRPLGGRTMSKVDVRILAATNRDLSAMVREGTFREDLFYRLNVFPINLPPLRERKEDIPALADHFIRKFGRETEKEVSSISAEAMKRLILHDWPGNVRELENIIHRAVILCKGKALRPEHILITGRKEPEIPKTSVELKQMKKKLRVKSVEDLERAFVVNALDRSKWNITRAAQEVGMQRTNFQALLKRYGIKRG